MIIKRLAEGIRNQDWFVVAVEIMIVVVGIFIGLQVDDWNEARKDRALEIEYLTRMADEFDQLIESEQGRLTWNEVRIAHAEKLLNTIRNRRLLEQDEQEFAYWIYYLGIVNRPRLSWGVVEELRSTGNIQLIKDLGLRQALTDMENQFRWYDKLVEEEAVLVRAYRIELNKLFQTIERDVSGNGGLEMVIDYQLEDFWKNPQTVNMISRIADYQQFTYETMQQNLDQLQALTDHVKAVRADLTGAE